MMKEGTSEQDAKDKIWLVDSRGLVVQNRPEGGVDRQKLLYARKHAPVKTLTEVVKKAKPTFLIGRLASLLFFFFLVLIEIYLNLTTYLIRIFPPDNRDHRTFNYIQTNFVYRC